MQSLIPEIKATMHFVQKDATGFPGGSDGEETACNAGNLGSIPGSGRYPGEGHGNPLQYSCLENPHGQRSLAGCSPWDRTKSDMAEVTQHTLRRQWDRQNWTTGRSLGNMGLQRVGHN